MRDPAGNLYGTTAGGGIVTGACGSGCGVVFRVDANGVYSVMYSFKGGTDGASPETPLSLDTAGNLYGTTYSGGAGNNGTVFKLDSSGTETVLYAFTGADGSGPESGVIRDPAGDLYGTTYYGGNGRTGVVYKLDAEGQESVICRFPGVTGVAPNSSVIADADGDLYGTTSSSGGSPEGALLLDAAGNLYGTTSNYGADNGGVLYKMDPAGNETVLYSFNPRTGPAYSMSGVVRDAAGSFYGVNDSVVYKVDAQGQFTLLYSFSSGTDGGALFSGLILHAAGNVYGTAYVGGNLSDCRAFASNGCGVVYKVSQAGRETVLYAFTGGDDGANPIGGLLMDRVGNLYGTASAAGKDVGGVIFKIENGVEAPFR